MKMKLSRESEEHTNAPGPQNNITTNPQNPVSSFFVLITLTTNTTEGVTGVTPSNKL
jgi:hypothetical protein